MSKPHFALVSVLVLAACGEDDPAPTPSPDVGIADAGPSDASVPEPTVPVVEAPSPGTTYVLAEARAERVMATITWTAAELGTPGTVRYRVELDVGGQAFDSPSLLGDTESLSLPVTVGFINALLLARALPAGAAAALELRVVAQGADASARLISEVVPIEVTPYAPTPAARAPVLASPVSGSTLTLDRDQFEAVAATFTWSPAELGTGTPPSYRVEIDAAGGDFTRPLRVGETPEGAAQLSVTHAQMNERVGRLGQPFGRAAAVQLRVVATSTDGTSLPSDPVAFTVQTFVFRSLGIPGSYQGWDPADPETTAWAVERASAYEGYVNFRDEGGEYKFTDGPSWDRNWGDDGADGTLDLGGANIAVPPNAQVVRLRVNLDELSHTLLVIAAWAVAGSAVPGDRALLTLGFRPVPTLDLTLDLVPGELAFEALDQASALLHTLGDADGRGRLTYGGGPIAIATAGRYRVVLDLVGPFYGYSITPQ